MRAARDKKELKESKESAASVMFTWSGKNGIVKVAVRCAGWVLLGLAVVALVAVAVT